MIEYSVFPQGKRRVVTFSFDDGPKQDAELIQLLNQYSVKATFHLNGKNYSNISPQEKLRVREQYQGHEIACHTLQHGWPERMPGISIVNEVVKDRLILEEIAGYPVVGMSYPYGSVSKSVAEAMAICGIVYGRMADSIRKMSLPQDFMFWHPTCHFKDAIPLCQSFLDCSSNRATHQLLYIWGHSYELRTETDWAHIETILKMLTANDTIWFATTLEVHDYINAQHQLRISADETILQNPSNLDVWVEKDNQFIIHVPAGKTVYLNQTT